MSKGSLDELRTDERDDERVYFYHIYGTAFYTDRLQFASTQDVSKSLWQAEWSAEIKQAGIYADELHRVGRETRFSYLKRRTI